MIKLEDEYRNKRDDLKNNQKENLILDKKLRKQHDYIVLKTQQTHEFSLQLELLKKAKTEENFQEYSFDELKNTQEKYKNLVQKKRETMQNYDKEKGSYDKLYNEFSTENGKNIHLKNKKEKELKYNKIKAR